MPIHDYLCRDCRQFSEILVFGKDDPPKCSFCGGSDMEKLLSAHSSASGPSRNSVPGLGDTTCCGSSPPEAGCAGPGSCCGKSFEWRE